MQSRGLSEFLVAGGTRLITRNSRAAEFSQATTDLAQSVFPWIPRPIEFRQWDGHNARRQELEQHMSHAQEERPAADPLPRTPLIVTQAQFFNLSEIDLNLEASGVGMYGFHGIKEEIGTQQIPGGEGEPGDGDDQDAGGQRAMGPDSAHEDGRLPDHGRAFVTSYRQHGVVLSQALGEAGEQLIDAAGLPKHPGAALARRATTRGKEDTLMTPQTAQRKLPLLTERAQQRATENATIGHPDVADGGGQAQMPGQRANQRRDRAPFAIEQSPDQDAGPLPGFFSPLPLEVGGEDVAVTS